MNLKYNYPVILFTLTFGAVFFFSFKHERAPESYDSIAASPQERLDQIGLSAMHAEPAPLESAAPNSSRNDSLLAGSVAPSPVDLDKIRTLDQLLAAKNDNDPRLDQDFKNLSPQAKSLMHGRYGATAAEKRNQRGTIVYLVGRELSSSDDVAFLHSVLSEPPCLSLSNCGAEDKTSMASGDHHHDGMNEVTLAYPQLTALKAIETYLGQPGMPPLTAKLLAVLETARQSPVQKIASMAGDISREYHSRHP